MKQRQLFQQAEIDHQKELLHAIIESQEAERKRIGQDLHDDVGSSLSGLRLMIEMFEPAGEADNYHNFKNSTKSIIDKTIKEVRNISHNLSPTTLRYYGLIAATTEHCTIINQSGILEVSLLNEGDSLLKKLELPIATALYRVLEELLNNTIKHSGASKASIHFLAKPDALMVDYNDNGKGLSSGYSTIKGMGLHNIESRLLDINATFIMDPYSGKGFHMNILCPVI